MQLNVHLTLARARENLIDLQIAIEDALDTLDPTDPIATAQLAELSEQYRQHRDYLVRHELREVQHG